MDWQLWLMGAAIFVLIYAIFKKLVTGKGIKVHKLGGFNIKKKAIAFGTPKRVELILIALYFVTGLWFDILMNQTITLGLSHEVQWFGDITTNAWSLAIVMLIAFHIILVTLFLFSLKQKRTNRIYDLIVGTAALFGVAILLSGAFAQIYGNTVQLFGASLNGTSYYHLGIATEAFAGLFWAFTD